MSGDVFPKLVPQNGLIRIPITCLNFRGLATFRIHIINNGTAVEVRTPCTLVPEQAYFLREGIGNWVVSYDSTLGGFALIKLAIFIKEQEGEGEFESEEGRQNLKRKWTFDAKDEELVDKSQLTFTKFDDTVTCVKLSTNILWCMTDRLYANCHCSSEKF